MQTIEQVVYETVIQEWIPYLEHSDFNAAVVVKERIFLYGDRGCSKRTIDKLREMGVSFSFSTSPLRIVFPSGAEIGFYHTDNIQGRLFSVAAVIETSGVKTEDIAHVKSRCIKNTAYLNNKDKRYWRVYL